MIDLFSIPVEQSVLVTLLTVEQGAGEYIDSLEVSDFYSDRHQIIFKHIKEQHEKGEGHNEILIWELIRSHTLEVKTVPEQYMIELMSGAVVYTMLGSLVKKLKDFSTRRKIQELSKNIGVVAVDTVSYSAEAALDRVQTLVSSLDGNSHENKTMSANDLSKQVLANILDKHEKIHAGVEIKRGIKTGFFELDNKLDCIDQTDLVIIGARPSMGKTTLAQNILSDVSVNQGEPALFMSGEMNKEQIMERLISGIGQIELKKIRSGRFQSEDAGLIHRAMTIIGNTKIEINDQSAPSLSDIRREARKMVRKYGKVGLIMVDYLQIMTPPQRTGNPTQEMGDISRGLKKLAKDFNCPVVALSQLNRSLENRPNKRPIMSDLRDSGQIEQDADVILFIYRDEVYNKESKDAGIAEIIVGKARNGTVGTVRLATDLARSTFLDLDPQYYQSMDMGE
ncbi:replicative DNA helicase [Acinetobacter baumannii]|uniref:replicative DNA helicase n=1 Tax=Acinetobacter baumannii TaxID=470 RepID=UPI0018974ACC|nr:replicative DNA helicase [Acinetobacter baumannii]MBF6792152.1 replicative DNA helicase [Acinetobacter baumannii]